MIKRILSILLAVLFIIPLAGCWNYRGLNEMSIAAGLAIDKDPISGDYKVLVELLDVTGATKEGPKTKLLETEGKTIFDALRFAKNKTANKLYFGNMSTVVIGNELAKSDDMLSIMDFFLRDAECRETLTVAIAKEHKAEELFKVKGIDSKIISAEIAKIAINDKKATSSTIEIPLYQMYNILQGEGRQLILPAFDKVMGENEEIIASDGLAVFKDRKLEVFLSRDDSQNVMFVLGKVKGGVLTFAYDSMHDNIALEIGNNKTKISYTNKNGKLKFKVATVTRVFLNESFIRVNALDKTTIEDMQKKMEQKLQNEIETTINKLKQQYNSDIFGFGNTIFKKDYKLWKKLKPDWDNTFRDLDVEVQCTVKIINTAAIVNTTKKK